MSEVILNVNSLSLELLDGKTVSPILNNISFTLKRGQRCGIVGSSGAGKSMTMYCLADLLPEKNSRLQGSICYYGKQDILKMGRKEKRLYCSKHTAVILQDSMNALNPYRTVCCQLEETVLHHHRMSRREAKIRIAETMNRIGLSSDRKILERYPGQFSGGMRQRIAIAMALESDAEILIADEPTTALDAINQMDFVRFLDELCRERQLSLLFISHNLGLVDMLCDDVLVMNQGEIIERGSVKDVFSNPKEIYTRQLIEGTRKLAGMQ